MDPKLQELLDRTNLAELIPQSVHEIDLNQPVVAAPPPKMELPRSTVDPFQINFASADIARKLQDSRTGSGVKAFALIFLGGPMIIFGLGMIYLAWAGPRHNPLGTLCATALGLGIAGFWPYVIYANRRKRAPRS